MSDFVLASLGVRDPVFVILFVCVCISGSVCVYVCVQVQSFPRQGGRSEEYTPSHEHPEIGCTPLVSPVKIPLYLIPLPNID